MTFTGQSLRALGLTCLSTLLWGAGLAGYGHYVEARWVEESHWVVEAENWRGRPLRLVVVADLHAREGDGAYLDDMVRRALALQPDVILLLGDYINESGPGKSMKLDSLEQHMGPLVQVPCYAVLGNHDTAFREKGITRMLENLGVRVVEGKLEALHVGGDTLHIAGIRCLYFYSTPEKPPEVPEGGTGILLTHSPAGAEHAGAGIVATLAGHTHGGQVCLPGGVPLARQDVGLEWWELRGEIERVGKPVYVCRGLGTSLVRMRLFCRPELLLVELRGKRRG